VPEHGRSHRAGVGLMPEYTIQSVTGPRTWNGQYGEMHSYDVIVDGIEGKVEISQKPTTPAPQVGDHILGTIEERNGFKKLKREPKASFGGGGGGGRANPEDMRQRAAQGALSNAVAFSSYLQSVDKPAPTSSSELLQVADKFYGWIRAKSEGK